MSIIDSFPRPPEWTEQALCAQVDPEMFHPPLGFDTRAAKKICGRCEVAAECLDYAIELGDEHGIYGGLSYRERNKVKRERRAA